MHEPPLIVVVDDDREFLKIMVAVLRLHHYRALPHLGEEGAVDLIVSEAPSLVIVDMLMEHTESGRRIIRELQKSSATAQIPTVVCSGENRAGEKVANLNVAHYVHLKKPFQPNELLIVIERLLKR